MFGRRPSVRSWRFGGFVGKATPRWIRRPCSGRTRKHCCPSSSRSRLPARSFAESQPRSKGRIKFVNWIPQRLQMGSWTYMSNLLHAKPFAVSIVRTDERLTGPRPWRYTTCASACARRGLEGAGSGFKPRRRDHGTASHLQRVGQSGRHPGLNRD
jgi:hypothetical protein